MRAMASGPRPDPYGRALWGHATARQRMVVLCCAVVLVVCAVLASLDPAVLPVVLAMLVMDAVLLTRLREVLVRRRLEDRRITVEAARGQRELERWLAFGEHACGRPPAGRQADLPALRLPARRSGGSWPPCSGRSPTR